MTFADAKQRFSNRVADYVRYRPGYPAPVLDLLRTDSGLRAGHVIAWNDRRMEEKRLTLEYEELLERFGIDYKRVKDSYPEVHHIRSFFGNDNFHSRDLPNEQVLDWDGLRGRLRSSSFAPTEDHPNYAPMMAELDRIFRAHQRDGYVRMEYFTRIYFGQLRTGT